MPTAADSLDDDADDPETYPDGVYADEPGTVACPYCGKEVSELAELCPHCKSYLSFEDAPSAPKPRWFVAMVILLIFMFSVGGLLAFLR